MNYEFELQMNCDRKYTCGTHRKDPNYFATEFFRSLNLVDFVWGTEGNAKHGEVCYFLSFGFWKMVEHVIFSSLALKMVEHVIFLCLALKMVKHVIFLYLALKMLKHVIFSCFALKMMKLACYFLMFCIGNGEACYFLMFCIAWT